MNMSTNIKWLLTIPVSALFLGGCCTPRHSQTWEYEVINAHSPAVDSPETQAALLNEHGKQGWIFVQNEGGWLYFKRAKR